MTIHVSRMLRDASICLGPEKFQLEKHIVPAQHVRPARARNMLKNRQIGRGFWMLLGDSQGGHGGVATAIYKPRIWTNSKNVRRIATNIYIPTNPEFEYGLFNLIEILVPLPLFPRLFVMKFDLRCTCVKKSCRYVLKAMWSNGWPVLVGSQRNPGP